LCTRCGLRQDSEELIDITSGRKKTKSAKLAASAQKSGASGAGARLDAATEFE
jgi:hypothetical protein